MDSRLAVRRLNRAEECTLDAREALDNDDPRDASRHIRDAMANIQYAFNVIATENQITDTEDNFYKARIEIDRCNSADRLDTWLGRESELLRHVRAAALDQEPLYPDGVNKLLGGGQEE